MSADSPVANEASEGDEPDVLHGLALSASLTVRDLPTSLAWYRDVVGFSVEREYMREGIVQAIALQAGDVRILLSRDNGALGSERKKGEGFSLMITIEQSIDEHAERIRARGGILESQPTSTPAGMRAFRLRDPDGFRLVISSVAGFR
jgi:uncharacterized glyoxalase superfamily protein PhnB